jgi:hypothetical protein
LNGDEREGWRKEGIEEVFSTSFLYNLTVEKTYPLTAAHSIQVSWLY